MVEAVLLESDEDLDYATPGLYVVRSGTPAYFPAMALIEDGMARFLGELYDESDGAPARIVTFEILPTPGALNYPLGHLGDERRIITIGREFFITALKDYDDWPLKWWRECVQNSIDAGAHNVALGDEKLDDGSYMVYCEDDGGGMDEDTVLNKFLVLGGTTKVASGGTAGGFGKAKELLLLPWLGWRIHTRDILIEGAGIDYTVKRAEYRYGTRLEAIMPADQHTSHIQAIAFLERCHLPQVAFTVNAEPFVADLVGVDLVTSVPDKADIYFTPATSTQSYAYVRTHGLYMFTRYIGEIPGYILVELTAPSIEILTANRDGFRDWSVARTIDKLAQKIAKDNLSALRSRQGMIRKKYEGTGKFRARHLASTLLEQIGPRETKLSKADSENVLVVLSEHVRRDEDQLRATQLPPPPVAQIMLDQKFEGPNHIEAAIEQLVWEPDFFLINEVDGWQVPKKFFPETMTPTVLKLAKTWVELCRYVLMQLGSYSKFGVGFIFSRETGAAALTEDDDGDGMVSRWLMLNPYQQMVEGPIWHPSKDADLKWLYAAAIHEATHIADGISYHDESFAAALTRNMAKCADGYRKIRKIAAGIRMRGGARAD